mgnify:FL=1
MFSKILIANRGEIAVRIIRACREMGIATVAIYSEADRGALYTALADECVCVGPALADESYLNQERIIAAAMATGAVAIHPGYGFLSENDQFAQACEDNDLVFIGAPARVMRNLSDKALIKKMMDEQGLPTIPGTEALSDVEEAVVAAERIGYPVMLKARSGGGGRGIRKVENEQGLRSVYHLAVAEAQASFGDGALYLEKCVYPARHVEFQVVADEKGNCVCLGERDCSVQRRHQKIIEEGPSPAVDEKARETIVKKITKAISAIGYVGLGTMEFLLDKEGHFWFMEMNLRLQVEHGVTELLTGIDLVKWQLRVACGVPLVFSQEDVLLKGASIECRINARSVGKVEQLHAPGGPFVRFDTFLMQDEAISPYYDSLVGKMIVWDNNRNEALRKMRAALCELVIVGIDTNIEELLELLDEEEFASGSYDLTMMEGR